MWISSDASEDGGSFALSLPMEGFNAADGKIRSLPILRVDAVDGGGSPILLQSFGTSDILMKSQGGHHPEQGGNLSTEDLTPRVDTDDGVGSPILLRSFGTYDMMKNKSLEYACSQFALFLFFELETIGDCQRRIQSILSSVAPSH